jgi:hypothetical protein
MIFIKGTSINLFIENTYEPDEIVQISKTENRERDEASDVEDSVNIPPSRCHSPIPIGTIQEGFERKYPSWQPCDRDWSIPTFHTNRDSVLPEKAEILRFSLFSWLCPASSLLTTTIPLRKHVRALIQSWQSISEETILSAWSIYNSAEEDSPWVIADSSDDED